MVKKIKILDQIVKELTNLTLSLLTLAGVVKMLIDLFR